MSYLKMSNLIDLESPKGYPCHTHMHDVHELRINGGRNSISDQDHDGMIPHSESTEPILRKSSQVVVIESSVSQDGDDEPGPGAICNNLRSTNQEVCLCINSSDGPKFRPSLRTESETDSRLAL